MLRSTRLLPNRAPKKLALAIGILCTQGLSQAQAQSDGEMRLEEIIVTSQKIAENIQDVPISVATVTGDKLADAGIENLEDLTAYLPNIHFTETGFSTQVRVRGIGSDNSQGFEQSVGMYIDGIYYGRSQLFRTPMMDMQRAELLRGPQSTLFGKNSIAGALNLTTATPTDELEARLSVSHEFENEQDEINAVISGPISDSLRARLAVRSYEEEGYYFNTFKELDEPNTEEQAARLTLDWTPTDSLQFIFKAEKNEFETFGRAIELTKDDPLVAGGSNYENSNILQLFSIPVPEVFESDLDYERQTDIPEFSDNQITNVTLTTNYDFNDYSLTLVTGHLAFDYKELCDCDFTALDIIELELNEDYEQFSQEIRIASPIGETIEWTAGAFYQDYDQTFSDQLPIRNSDNILTTLISASLADTGVIRDFEQTSEAWAVFGRLKWNISDDFSLIVGARYTDEQKEASKSLNVYTPSTGDVFNNAAVGGLYLVAFQTATEQSTGHNVSDKRSESPFDPLIIAEYHFTDDIMGYASFTTGSKAGGYDPRSNNVASFEFEEEESTAFELGVKTTLADGRGELNAALYRTDYDDLQISQFDGAVGFNVGNAKETVVQGIEVDGRWLLTESMTVSYGLSWLDFEYTDFENGNCHAGQASDTVTDGLPTCSYTGKRGVYTPDYTINLGFDYFRPITDNMDFVSFLDIQQVDDHNVHVNLDPTGEIDAYTIVNFRVGLQSENWSVGVLAKNLLDEEVVSYSANAPLSDTQLGTNTHYSFVRRPMTVALEVTLKF